MRKKLTKAQKAKSKAVNNAIRKEYNKVKDKANVSYIQFKRRVKSRLEADGAITKNKRGIITKNATADEAKLAAKKEARTETFLKAPERSRENLIDALKEKYNEAYSELRNLSRNKGKFQSIKDNLIWDKDRNGYILEAGDKSYFIDVSNSPEEVTIVEID